MHSFSRHDAGVWYVVFSGSGGSSDDDDGGGTLTLFFFPSSHTFLRIKQSKNVALLL